MSKTRRRSQRRGEEADDRKGWSDVRRYENAVTRRAIARRLNVSVVHRRNFKVTLGVCAHDGICEAHLPAYLPTCVPMYLQTTRSDIAFSSPSPASLQQDNM